MHMEIFRLARKYPECTLYVVLVFTAIAGLVAENYTVAALAAILAAGVVAFVEVRRRA